MGSTPEADTPGSRVAQCYVGAESADIELPIFVAPYNCRIKEIRFIPVAAIAGDLTNYANLQFRKNGAGANHTNLSLSATSVAALARTTVSAALDVVYARGAVLTLNLDIFATFTMPRTLYEIVYEPDYAA